MKELVMMMKIKAQLKKQDSKPEVLVQMSTFIGFVIVFLNTG
jgi:hypothetical protein